MELAEPRWREDQSYLEKYCPVTAGGMLAHRKRCMRRTSNYGWKQNASCRAAGQVGRQFAAGRYRSNMREAQRLLPYRENGKYYLMLGYETIRLALLETARRWELGPGHFLSPPR